MKEGTLARRCDASDDVGRRSIGRGVVKDSVGKW